MLSKATKDSFEVVKARLDLFGTGSPSVLASGESLFDQLVLLLLDLEDPRFDRLVGDELEYSDTSTIHTMSLVLTQLSF